MPIFFLRISVPKQATISPSKILGRIIWLNSRETLILSHFETQDWKKGILVLISKGSMGISLDTEIHVLLYYVLLCYYAAKGSRRLKIKPSQMEV